MTTMQSTVHSGTAVGIEGVLVEVEVDVSNGLPHFLIVGLGDTAVQESKERVRAALRNSGFEPPATRITVSLAPGDLRKAGVGFDLAIALGLLASSGALDGELLDRFVFLGELALDGGVRRVPGVLPVAIEARRQGKGLVVPAHNEEEACLVDNLDVWALDSLAAVVAFVRQPGAPAARHARRFCGVEVGTPDLADVKGQDTARRALEISAAGGHNLLFIGPPGAGKSMLARRLPSILPPLTEPEALEVTAIYSVGGLLQSRRPLVTQPPFRAPHHSISPAGLIGGTSNPRPGEVSLAHRGILFLDELGEFTRTTLEVLRQPIEDRRVVISRAKASVCYPADFALAAAMNPCPCGFQGDSLKICTCPPARIERYWSRISGPLLDRIDLQVEVPRLKAEEVLTEPAGECSQRVRDRVLAARERQGNRFRGMAMVCNGQIRSRELRAHCAVDTAGRDLLRQAITSLGLSARTHDRVLKVARTIADLAGADRISSEHVKEAIGYRFLDSRLRA